MKTAPDIYRFLDYRAFLKDWFDWKKRENKNFSHRLFAMKAGLKSPALLANVISGRRNLTSQTVEAFLQAMKLLKEERVFFAQLVKLDQAKTDKERNLAWRNISATKRFREARRIEGESVAYLSHWYYPAIRELALRRDFRGDPEWIAAQLRPMIKVEQAKQALEALISLGMLAEKTGRLRPADGTVVTPMEVAGMAVHNYHRGMLERAGEAMDAFDPDERYLGGLTVAIPETLVEQVKDEIKAFQSRMLDLCDSAKNDAERVYQLGLQFFPLSAGSEEP
jgi:uncharacterized protein (TIGR02147 family)